MPTHRWYARRSSSPCLGSPSSLFCRVWTIGVGIDLHWFSPRPRMSKTFWMQVSRGAMWMAHDDALRSEAKDGRENCTDRAFLRRHANAVSEVETITNTSRTAREPQVTKHKTSSPHTQSNRHRSARFAHSRCTSRNGKRAQHATLGRDCLCFNGT